MEADKLWSHYMWNFIHCSALYFNNLLPDQQTLLQTIFFDLHEIIPCEKCKSAIVTYDSISRLSDNISNCMVFFEWTVGLHNFVNAKLGKKEFGITDARALYCNITQNSMKCKFNMQAVVWNVMYTTFVLCDGDHHRFIEFYCRIVACFIASDDIRLMFSSSIFGHLSECQDNESVSKLVLQTIVACRDKEQATNMEKEFDMHYNPTPELNPTPKRESEQIDFRQWPIIDHATFKKTLDSNDDSTWLYKRLSLFYENVNTSSILDDIRAILQRPYDYIFNLYVHNLSKHDSPISHTYKNELPHNGFVVDPPKEFFIENGNFKDTDIEYNDFFVGVDMLVDIHICVEHVSNESAVQQANGIVECIKSSAIPVLVGIITLNYPNDIPVSKLRDESVKF